MTIRFDKGTLKSPRRLDNGCLIVEGVLTRTGVFRYRNDDGSERLEYRPPSEVFNADSMLSFQLVPVTDDHPQGKVTSETAKAVSIGSVGESVRQDGKHLVAPLAINDASAVTKLDSGKVELSCGYTCDLEEKPGVSPDGERYDAIQRNIRGNHVALVHVGRAGPEARIHMDGASFQIEAINMDELTKALKQVAEQQARADRLEAELKVANSRADKAEGERDSEKERADKADKQRTDAADGFSEAIKARVSLEAAAADLAPDFKCDGASDREIKVACIKSDCEGKSEDYVQARFDVALERASEASGEEKIYAGKTRVTSDQLNTDSAAETSRQKMLERNSNAWKGE